MFSQLYLTGCKKRKRGERVFKFKSFCEEGNPVEFGGPFWKNVKALLEFGHRESNFSDKMPSWSFLLEVHRHPPAHVLLFVIEEPIEESLYCHCKHCQYIGWGHHMICNKKYHFLVPSKDAMVACLGWEGPCDGACLQRDKFNLLDLQGHTLHGVFHSNGFGHLLSINGLEMGSDLSGHQIMDFWDRLCTGLRARKVSLIDISQKRGMDLRLLNGVAYGEPWFHQWGYKFGRGSFGVTHQMYKKAIQAIQGTPLCLIIHHLPPSSSNSSINHEISIIFSRYQVMSNYSLVTLGDLLRFMLELSQSQSSSSGLDSYNPEMLVGMSTCRWSPKRVEMATHAIIEALKRAEFRWVSRQEVRDAARAYIGDTGLLDFVLKSLGNQVVGNYLVRRTLNPVTKVLEYCLEDISAGGGAFRPDREDVLLMNNPKSKSRYKVTGLQLTKDIFFLYKHMLIKEQMLPPIINNSGILKAISMAASIILDAKHLIKEYSGGKITQKHEIYCSITLRDNVDNNDLIRKATMPPYERVCLRNTTTINELKLEVQETFREIYWEFRNFIVESILNLNAKGSDSALELVEAGSKLVFVGSSKYKDAHEQPKSERSSQSNGVVDCPCGTKEDDGERMVACDICAVWQHSRCARIAENEEIPLIYLCNRCEQDIILFPSLP